jgi:hypothetical protein
VNKNFCDFVEFLTAIIVELSENPAVKIESQISSYDATRHLIRVIAATNSGDVFSAEFPPECEPDLLKDEAIPFGAAIRGFLKQQLALATSVAEQAHSLAWSQDHARRALAH